MANYYAAARSNYFNVVDVEKFENDMSFIPGIEVETDKEGRMCVLASGDDCGCWPGFVQIDMDDIDDGRTIPAWLGDAPSEEFEVDLPVLVAEHLADGEVAVFMESGAEKLRYIIGFAEAINNKGERKTISLNDIYDMAKDMTNRPNDITTAEY